MGGGKVVLSRSANFEQHSGWERIHCNKEVFVQFGQDDAETEGVDISVESEESSLSDSEEVLNVPSPRSRLRDRKRLKKVRRESSEEEASSSENIVLRRSKRVRKPPDRYGKPVSYQVEGTIVQKNEPENFSQVEESPDAEEWLAAMDTEFTSMIQQQVFDVVDRPKNQRVVDCRWVYKRKQLPDGNTKYKARLVARGFTQTRFENYDKTFAPTARPESLRLMLTLAAKRRLEIRHFDFETAYLNARLDEEIYMEQAPGFKAGGQVYLLKKAIYGLKQSARCWNLCVHEQLSKLGFKRSVADACVYTRGVGDEWVGLLLYVDDLCCMAKDIKRITNVQKELEKRFKIKDLGPLQNYVGLEVCKCENGKICLSQRKKIEQLIETCGLTDAKTVSTPMIVDYVNQDSDKVFERPDLYHSIIGSLMYISNHTRPDISYAVSYLSRRVAKPRDIDWVALKRVVRYLKGTIDHCLIFGGSEENIDCFADSSFATEQECKSVTGVVVKFAGSMIIWRSRKQNCVARSTTESEYSALSETVSELQWLQQLMYDLGEQCETPIRVKEDSQACIAMTEVENLRNRTKYIGVKYHAVKQLIEEGVIMLEYCPSEANVADVLTKALPTTKHECFREQLRVLHVE